MFRSLFRLFRLGALYRVSIFSYFLEIRHYRLKKIIFDAQKFLGLKTLLRAMPRTAVSKINSRP